MMNISEQKQLLRKEIAQLKRSYSTTELNSFSIEAITRLEQSDIFHAATSVAIYHAIPGEVQTSTFIEKWYKQKTILLPVINGNDLQLLPYKGKESLKSGIFGIQEPTGNQQATTENEIDLIVVPGIAFDRQMNRMGRGKGYYDRLLSTLTATKAGLCFHFQLIEKVPAEVFDRKMDMLITDREIIQLATPEH